MSSGRMFVADSGLRPLRQYLVINCGPTDLTGAIGSVVKPGERSFDIVEFDSELRRLDAFVDRRRRFEIRIEVTHRG